jgi:uroporphyrin-III C-methyltransferase
MNPNLQPKGKVIFAGSGPGDPELLTIKAHRFLRCADVVITDRLVSDIILEEYVNKQALVLHVGKQSGNSNSTSQSLINELLVEYAMQGKLIVRLKGGDVTIFSNLLDELSILSEYGIPYEIIPGITAASGAAAYAGIPLTARQYSNAVRFLTYYPSDTLEEPYWKDLAETTDTLVFYMSSGRVSDLVEKMVRHGVADDRYLSIIEQATTPMQQVYTCKLDDYLEKGASPAYISPTLLIIGKVAALQTEYQWVPNSNSSESYFKPVRRRIQTEERA